MSGKDDINALLYIVVTLLFYSMGIVIGIITYLKREQAEMEEDKMFDMYMQLKREPFNVYKVICFTRSCRKNKTNLSLVPVVNRVITTLSHYLFLFFIY